MEKTQPNNARLACAANGTADLSALPPDFAPCAVALGFFDGVHRGHAALLRATAEEAARRNLLPTVFTFYDQSGIKSAALRLSTPEERYARIRACGISQILLADFSTLRDLTPAAFVREVLVERLHARLVVCGENYRFGRGGAGDVDLLARELATHGVPLLVAPTEKIGDVTVSSSAIREALEAGETARANEMLGYRFSLSAPVLHGRALGRTIGIPTANQCFPVGSVLPAAGVYAVYATVEGRRLAGIANVGRHPTVAEGDALNCETHLLSYEGDLYGKMLTVEFLHRLRPEQKFANIDELRRAVCADIEQAERMKLWENGQN